MAPLKEEILLAVYEEFADWSKSINTACEKRCSACCTQNVTITAVEGEVIHRFIHKQQRQEWFADRIRQKGATRRPKLTTNQFAALCLKGEDASPESIGNYDVCPFLEDDCCSIYEARPFSCRSFASEIRCTPEKPAEIAEHYLSAVTAVMQIIEHLGQGEYWGNMLDVLGSLCDLPENRVYMDILPASLSDQYRANVVKAVPSPGFLIPEEDWDQVSGLLSGIFSRRIGDKNIEQILNNENL
ncbi:MAG: YkgJ family cysteine cluster protein [Thermodesulfobacteriota bacterium]